MVTEVPVIHSKSEKVGGFCTLCSLDNFHILSLFVGEKCMQDFWELQELSFRMCGSSIHSQLLSFTWVNFELWGRTRLDSQWWKLENFCATQWGCGESNHFTIGHRLTVICVFLSRFHQVQKELFWGVDQSSNCSLPYSLLLDYSTLRSPPYPTWSWKTTTHTSGLGMVSVGYRQHLLNRWLSSLVLVIDTSFCRNSMEQEICSIFSPIFKACDKGSPQIPKQMIFRKISKGGGHF